MRKIFSRLKEAALVLRRSWWWIIPAALAIDGPALVYIRTFGTHISTDHTRWAEMGSAMSGIYGPILSILTFLVLIMQMSLQRQTNEHMFEQAYLQDARADIEFYLKQMADLLDKPMRDGSTPRIVLQDSFENATAEQLLSDELKRVADALCSEVEQLESVWAATNVKFRGLKSRNADSFNLQLRSNRNKSVAVLSPSICCALDNFLYCRAEGDVSKPFAYQFSRELRNLTESSN